MPRNKKYFSRRNWGIYAHARRPHQSLNPILNKQCKKELGEQEKWQYFKVNP